MCSGIFAVTIARPLVSQRSIASAIEWHAKAHGRAPHIVLYQSNLWDIALLEGINIARHEPGHASFLSYMQPFTYADPSVGTRWMRNYVRNTEANIVHIRKLAPAPQTLLITRTSPLTNHRFQSAVNTAIRKIATKRCIPLIDWDELAHVHMLGDASWAQTKQVRCSIAANRLTSVIYIIRFPVLCRVGMLTKCTQMLSRRFHMALRCCDSYASSTRRCVRVLATETPTNGITVLQMITMQIGWMNRACPHSAWCR